MIHNRRNFIKTSALAGIGLSLSDHVSSLSTPNNNMQKGGRIGMIGLDTSHVTAFTGIINDPSSGSEFEGFRVTAAYPTKGSSDMPSSINRLQGFTDNLRERGVEIVGSIDELLEKVDFVLLESVDGRRHVDEALPVLKAGKRMFIDKPVSNSLTGAIAIYNAAKHYNVPVFSASATRFAPAARKIVQGTENISRVLGADTYCPAGPEVGHMDFAFYGIHAVESLFTLMGTGCKNVVRISTPVTNAAVGTWDDGRVGIFRATPSGGRGGFGGRVFGDKGIEEVEILAGYRPLLVEIMEYFRTGVVPVTPEETIELFAFMKAADESKLYGGSPINLDALIQRSTRQANDLLRTMI
jgi:predicted dehydrogenase